MQVTAAIHFLPAARVVIAIIAVGLFLFTPFMMRQNVVGEALAATPMGVVAIPYFSPTSSSWNTIYSQADGFPGTIRFAIINPCSGPCAEQLSLDWQNVISNLKSRGITTLGYIYYTKESIANIDYYMKNPAIKTDGIFFDKEGSSDNLFNFQKYADYVHNATGMVFINPGYNYPPVSKYLSSGAADVANIYEAGLSRLFQMSVPSDIKPEKLSAIVKSVNKETDMQKAISQVAAKGVGNVYITSMSYTSLPSYFPQEVKTASSTIVQ
jgi:hypothetical protein